MRTNSINLQLVGLFVLSMIPWPGPTVFKISCPRDNARIVRKIIQSKWMPVLEKYKVNIPLECPFHPQRDIFGPQQSAKHQHRPSQWTCGFCGKSFFEERFLDMHFDNRHKSNVNMVEDAVCLSDYCDIMRCDVLVTQDAKVAFPESVNTDVEIWREATAYRTALATSGPRDLARYTVREGGFTPQSKAPGSPPSTPGELHNHCEKTEAPEPDDQPSSTDDKAKNQSWSSCRSDLVDAALPAADFKQQRILELQKLKANCKPDELHKLKTRCEILVRDCIAGLLIQLSINDFKEVEEELNKAVCWYLTCDRYWEDSQTDSRVFPWGLLFMIVMVLSLGICLCYYIIWVLFDSDDISVTSVTDRSTPSPAHTLRGQSSTASNSVDAQPQVYTEDYYTASDKELGQNEHYIYVTYPPDLKRRLLESCYNRTTRL
ncbi:uncharacterized protein CBL_06814 [Carabus blaptoides fortunei]